MTNIGAFLGACKPPPCPNDPMPLDDDLAKKLADLSELYPTSTPTHAEPWSAQGYSILDQNRVDVEGIEIIGRLEAQQRALHLVLAFHRGGRWTDEDRTMWREITGSDEATTKVMCDHIRKTLGLSST